MSNVEYKPAEKLQIKLIRPDSNTPWGFRLQGGTDFNTPLSIQSVNPDGVAEKCGLKAGDSILTINNANTDAMTHDDAKGEIVKSGNEISMLVERGAVKIWKPKVTPFNELRPLELNKFTSAVGDDVQPVQKTSLAANKSPDEPCRIGSSHNRSPIPFGKFQYNSPAGLYSADNIQDAFSQQKEGIERQIQSLDLKDGSNKGDSIADTLESKGFHSVSAPVTKPASDKPQQTSMMCGGCNTLATGVIVKANDVPYHAACFKCTSCSVNLKQKGFFVVQDKLYCDIHAKDVAKPPESGVTAVSVDR